MNEYEGDVVTYYDKVVHVIIFGILAFLSYFALIDRESFSAKKALVVSLVGSVLYAGFCEVVQSFIPGRTESLYDLLAGALGVVIALVIAYGVFRREKA